MASLSDRASGLSSTSGLAACGLLCAGIFAIAFIERGLPRPMPWMRPGLGNSMVLTAMVLGGHRLAGPVALAKVLAGGVIFGSFGGPGFLMSLAGTVASYVAMASFLAWGPPATEFGVSIAGACFHSCGQLAVIGVLLTGPGPVLLQAGPVIFFSLAAGTVSGGAAQVLIKAAGMSRSGVLDPAGGTDG